MNNKVKREINDLEKQKKRALQKSNLVEAAKYCNLIGETLSRNGFCKDAFKAHKEEIQLSEDANDIIGVAVGNRKVGECLCELNRFEEAIEHQKQHLKLSKSVDNLLEQQRALATLGRTYFVQSDCYCDDANRFNKCLLQSQKYYLKSLEICNKLHHGNTVSDKDILEMKARLYLNLGLTYEYKQDIKDALKFVNKALIISREQKLTDDIYRCHYTLSGLHLYDKNYQRALQSVKSALMIAKDGNHNQQEMDALHQMGIILLRLAEFRSSFQTLKKVYKSAVKKDSTEEIPVRNLKLAMKGLQLHQKYGGCENEQELMNLCEKLGDYYHEIETPEKALHYYLQQCSHANDLGICGKSLATIYISIAVTYGECKQHQKALEFYEKELGLRQGELKEKSSTYCAMAKCMEDLGVPFEEIKETYMKALQCAQESGHKNDELKVLEDFASALEGAGLLAQYENIESKVKQLKTEMEECQDGDGESEQDMEEGEGSQQTSSQFNSQELQMLESDSENENDEEESHLNETTSRGNSRRGKQKVNKVNERGETLLHLAAISGNAQRTSELLKQGANAKSRDYCGWQPLHEACNHGAADVVKLLLEHGADVNDPGGKHCGGVTPLHDASQNGHLAVVELLVSWNANVRAKSKEGFTPLELVQRAIEADNEEFSGSYAEDNELLNSRKEVEKYLKCVITNGNQRYRQQSNGTNKDDSIQRNRNKIIFDNPSSGDDESADDAEVRIPSKRQRVGNEFEDNCFNSVEDGFVQTEACIDGLHHAPPLLDPDTESARNSDLEDVDFNEIDNVGEDLSPGICSRNDSFIQELDLIEKKREINTPRKDVNSRPDHFQSDKTSTNRKSRTPRKDTNQPNYHSNTTMQTTHAVAGKNVNYRPELQSGNINKTSNEKQNTSKERYPYTRVIQSKIGFARSPSPSMLDENDIRLQDFIINDMPTVGTSSSKNKIKNGRRSRGNNAVNRKKQQSCIDFNSDRSSNNIGITRNRNASKSGKQQRKRKQKGKSIGAFTEIDVGSDSPDECSSEGQEKESVDSTTENCGIRRANDLRNETLAGPLFRVKVRIAEQCYLIPCQQPETLTIGWLIEQAVERYHAVSNILAKLALKTKDNALLNRNDMVSDVVMNNEELIGEILGFQFPPLLERYSEQCKQCQTEPLTELMEDFSLEDNLYTLQLKGLFLHAKELQAIFTSVLCNTSITCIDLSGIFIGDNNFQQLVPTLHSLPNICTLNLSTSGITAKSLLAISNIVSSQPKEEFALIMKKPPLSTLRSLHFSYNDFSDEESFSPAMKTISERCGHLEDLNLSNCRLTAVPFQRKQMWEAFKVTNMKSLNLSYNSLGTWSEVVEIVSLFNVSSLEYLDLSSATSSQNQEKIQLSSLARLFESNLCVLQELHLDRLPAISRLDEGYSLDCFCTNLQTLSIRHQSCSIETFNSLNRSVSKLRHLCSVDFSFSKTFDETHLDGLLNDLKTNSSPLEELKLTSCNICSRLPENIYETLSVWKNSPSSGCRLKSIDLTHNELSTYDKNQLKNSWDNMHRTAAYCDMKTRVFRLYCNT